MIKGSCICGKIEYELSEQGQLMNNCHCSQCRKASGAAFGSFLHISKDYFKWLKGEEFIQVYKPSSEINRSFCKICGYCIPSIFEEYNNVVVPAGTLDDDPNLKPIVNIYIGSKASWYTITDNLPAYEERVSENFIKRYLTPLSDRTT
jgi:hypothetical protein